MNDGYLSEKVFHVSELCQILKGTVAEMFYGLSVEGEICNFKSNQSRHWYFSIKDKDGSMLNCTCFAGSNWRLEKPENGDYVILKGSLSFWPKGGSLSFNAENIEKKGEGDLRAEIEKRRAYYRSLGYFDDERKREIPKEIKTIGIVTSAEGAVIHDIMNVTRRRAPGIDLLLFPSLVQGKGAELSIAKRIRQANNFACCDVLIVARGGGSEEDLAPYSSSEVIEAIHNSFIPVVSAVGHDSDFPLSDFAADLRAPTPSAAAEILTESYYSRRMALQTMEDDIKDEMLSIIQKKKMEMLKLKTDASSIFRRLERCRASLERSEDTARYLRTRMIGISYEKANLDNMAESAMLSRMGNEKANLSRLILDLGMGMKGIRHKAEIRIRGCCFEIEKDVKEKARRKRSTLTLLSSRLEDLNPLSILDRGYSIIENGEGKIVKDVRNMKAGEEITIRLRGGKAKARVEEIWHSKKT